MNVKPNISPTARIIDKIADDALAAMRASDNEFGKLLALRNAAKALFRYGPEATERARRRIVESAFYEHRLSEEVIDAAVVMGSDLARTPRGPSTQLPLAQSSVEALMFSLRRGLMCLEDPANVNRLFRCDLAAVEQIAKRLHANGWPADDIEKLIDTWRLLVGDIS